MESSEFIVEPLTKKHIREKFDCGEESLNVFLKRFARQNNDKGLSRTYVLVKADAPDIYGYYTIASGALSFEDVPENLPRYPIPVVHLGRLAIDRSVQGRNLGKALLAHALERSAGISEELGIYAVEVYALNQSARRFYLRFGFSELLDDKMHPYLSVKKIRSILQPL